MKQLCKRILALLLLTAFLRGGTAMIAAAAQNAAAAEPAQAIRYAPYALPAEAAGATYLPAVTLQSGNLNARWVAPGLQSQALSAADAYIEGLQTFKPWVDLTAYGLTGAALGDLMNDTLNAHPELFYSDGIYYLTENGIVTRVWFSYTAAISVLREQTARLEAVVELILAQVPANLTDAGKVLWCNEYIAMHNAYPTLPADPSGYDPYWFNVYGALCRGSSVCQGIALANCLLLTRLGVTCAFVTSEPMNHAWNLVRLEDDSWYHVDTTWNDGPAEYGNVPDIPGYVNHDYLLLSDHVMRDAEHRHSGWVAPAQATSDAYLNAYWIQTNSAIVPLNDSWYYTVPAGGWVESGGSYQRSFDLRSRNFGSESVGQDTFVRTLSESVSPVPGDKTKFAFFRRLPSLAVLENTLYYSNGGNLFSLTPAALAAQQGASPVMPAPALNQANYQSVCGFAVYFGELRYGVIDASGGGGARLFPVYGSVQLSPTPTLPAVSAFDVNYKAISLRYRDGSARIVTSPGGSTFAAEDAKLVSVRPDGTLQNEAFGEEGFTGVYVYGPDGQEAYVLVEYYTEWWQWFIWIFLFGWVWY
ncbi:MAG: hypothetical protein LBC83_00430 [Oscillospiraceae bacterium]|jgi:hypothetical protein|nr:hypothetical protein [Oscillospiraceae bacterium]